MQKHLRQLEQQIKAAKNVCNQMAQNKEEMISNITTAMSKVRVSVDKAQQELVDQTCKLFDAQKKNIDCHTHHLNTIRECVGALLASKHNLPFEHPQSQAIQCTAVASWVAQATNVNQQCIQLCQQSPQAEQRLILLTTAHMNAMCNDLERVLLRTKVAYLLCLDPTSPQSTATPTSTSTSTASTTNNSVVFGTTPQWKAPQCVATSSNSVRLVWESGLGGNEEWMRGEGPSLVGLQFRVVLKESTPHDNAGDRQGPCTAAKVVHTLRVRGEDETDMQQAEGGGKVVFEGRASVCDVTNLADKHHHVFELCAVYHDCTPSVRVVCSEKIVVCTPTYRWLEFASISADGVQLTNHRKTLTRTTTGGHRFGIGKELPQNTVVKWKFRIVKSSSSAIMCGIISTNTKGNSTFCNESSFTCTALQVTHILVANPHLVRGGLDGKAEMKQ